ncbi:MAG: SapC family protein [Thiomicrospira sp.]
MSEWILLTPDETTGLGWRRSNHYGFCAQDAVVSLVYSELTKAIQTFPLCFISSNPADQAFELVGLQSFVPNVNLNIDEQGNWIAPYVPAAYRSYPFNLIAGDDPNQFYLGFDKSTGLLCGVSEPDALCFFGATGRPIPEVQAIIEFMQQRENQRKLTQEAVNRLAQYNLIQPWEMSLNVADGEREVQGLFRIDEQALLALPSEALFELNRVGALSIAYGQLFSIEQLEHLKTRFYSYKPYKSFDLETFFDESNNDSIYF